MTDVVAAYEVRTDNAGDRQQLIDLWRRVFPNDPPRNAPDRLIDSKVRVQPDLLIVVDGEQGLVGAVMGGYDGFRGWIYHLAVSPDHRRRGVGTKLVGEVERRLKALGCSKVNLQIRASNQSVTDFYVALGYEVEERVSMGRVL